MRHLCEETTLEMIGRDGTVCSLPAIRYRELAVIRDPFSLLFYITLVPEGSIIFENGHESEEVLINLMVELDKLSNNWIGLSADETYDLIMRAKPLIESVFGPILDWTPNEDYIARPMNGYSNG